MLDRLTQALEAEPDVLYALVFGSTARGTRNAGSDVDVAVELGPSAARDAYAIGALVSRLEAATGVTIDLVLLDQAPSPVAYRVFREGQLLLERHHAALVARKARAIVEYLDFKPIEDLCAAGVLRRAPRVVDKAVLADRIALVRDAAARVRATLPPSLETFAGDRTAREIVALNLLLAIQACIALASHWLADEGWSIPATYGQTFVSLADHGVIERPLADRLAAAAGLRNLLVHQYGTVDWRRIHALASSELADLEAFCAALAAAAD